MNMTGWRALGLELELWRWARAGRTPVLWWRDDDACQPTPALERLIEVAQDAPFALAVVPDRDLTPLAAALAGRTNVSISQHGSDHINRRRPDEPVGEHPSDARPADIVAKVGPARARLEAAGLRPDFYTPPWNRIDAALPEALATCGFSRVSAWGGSPSRVGGLWRLDAHVDVLRWNPQPRFRGTGRLLADLGRQLAARRKAGAWDEPVGLLTHHLVHDEATWEFLRWFVGWTRGRMLWKSFEQLAGA